MHIDVAGTRLFFDVVGSGLDPVGPRMVRKPALIVLHGGPGADHTIHRPAFDALGDVAQVVYVDHRGQGRSAHDAPERWNLATWGDDVRALCDALGIERPVVLGHSFGGMVAMAYATRHPDHPGALVLSATYARQNVDRIARRCHELGGDTASDAARAMWATPSAESMAHYDRVVLPLYMTTPLPSDALESARRVRARSEVGLHFAADEMQRFDYLEALARVTCPTLVVGGTHDPVCPIEDQEEIARALSAAPVTFERFEGCSHMLWLDAPERYFAVLRAFLASLGDGAPSGRTPR